VADQADPPVNYRAVFSRALVTSLAVLLVAFVVISIYVVRGLLVQVVVAAFIAMSLDPAVRWMISKGVKRSQAVAIIFMLVVLAVAGFLYATIPTLVSEASRLGKDFPGFLDHLRTRSPSLAHLEDRFHLKPRIDRFAQELPGRLGHGALAFGTRFFGALISFLLVLVLSLYFMADLPRLRRGIVRLFVKRHRPHASHVVNVVIDKVGSYMIGNIVISLIAGTAAFAAMEALRVPFALPLAVVVAITDLIPLVGATAGAVICVVVALGTTNLWPNTALLAVFFLLYQQLENYLIAPRVLRNAVDLQPVAVLLVALIGASVLGVVGALMAVPVAAAVKVVAVPMLRARDEAAEQEANADAEGDEPDAVDVEERITPDQAAGPNTKKEATKEAAADEALQDV
jgi:predicted PurR-regulated permease PerM